MAPSLAEVLALAQKVDAMDAACVKLLDQGISLAEFVKASPALKQVQAGWQMIGSWSHSLGR